MDCKCRGDGTDKGMDKRIIIEKGENKMARLTNKEVNNLTVGDEVYLVRHSHTRGTVTGALVRVERSNTTSIYFDKGTPHRLRFCKREHKVLGEMFGSSWEIYRTESDYVNTKESEIRVKQLREKVIGRVKGEASEEALRQILKILER